MNGMFSDTTAFDQDPSSWDVGSVSLCWGFSIFATNWTAPEPRFTKC